MAQSSANWEDPDFGGGEPEAGAAPALDNGPGEADATNSNAASAIGWSDPSDPSDRSDQSGAQPRSQPAQDTQSGTPAQPPAPGAPPAPRQRQPVKQIGQIPIIDSSWMLEPFPGPFAQAQDPHAAWMQKAQQSQAQWAQITRINQGGPYISEDDGRWKKQSVDSRTGAVNETDVLDAGLGKINCNTGDIYLQTGLGQRVIGADPQQKLLTQIVGQKAQAQAQGSPLDANIAAAKSAFLDTQDQLQDFQGIPERMSAQVGKYTQASLDPGNTAAAYRLQQAQADFNNWKQQNPSYTGLIARRDALANQIQTLTDAKKRNDLQVAQLLTTPQYIQWTANTPPSIGAAGPGAAPDGSAPSSDISIHDLDARAGVIAAQTGFPAGLAYASAIREAKLDGARTVDGDAIDDAINGIQPAAQAQLPTMTPPQLRKAFQAGLISRRQAEATAMAQHAARDQAQAAASADNGGQQTDPVQQSIADLTARAADLRNKIQSAFDTGGADGARDLATYRAALADTESQLHAATQTLVNRVPAVVQQSIVRAVAPDLDWDSATQRNSEDPIAHFATENLGSALRDQEISPDLQRRIRQLATSGGFNTDVADHIANQAVGANAVRSLTGVLQGRSIEEGKANTLQAMGFLQQSDPDDPGSPLHLTEDAQRLLPPGAQRFVQLRPDLARYTPSADPAHGSALYQNAVAGMQRFSDTAERTLAARSSESEADAPLQPDVEQASAPDTAVAAEDNSQRDAGASGHASQGGDLAGGELTHPGDSAQNGRDEASGSPGGLPESLDQTAAPLSNDAPIRGVRGREAQKPGGGGNRSSLIGVEEEDEKEEPENGSEQEEFLRRSEEWHRSVSRGDIEDIREEKEQAQRDGDRLKASEELEKEDKEADQKDPWGKVQRDSTYWKRLFNREAEIAAQRAIGDKLESGLRPNVKENDDGTIEISTPITGSYRDLIAKLKRTGFQANHLNQNAAYRGIIPEDEGFSVGTRGNAITEIGSPHYNFHESLEEFWAPYRRFGEKFGLRPTNAEYGAAMEQALIKAGYTPAQAAILAAGADAQRTSYGLAPNGPVPHVPGRLPQTKR